MISNINRPGYKYTPLGWIPEEWEVKSLSEIGNFSKGKGILKDQLLSIGLPCLRYGEIYSNYNFVAKEFKSFISEEVASESQKISKGDILFAGSGETIEEIGKAIAYTGNQIAYAGGDIIIFSPQNVDSLLISYLLELDSSRKQKRVLGQGNSIVHIYTSDLQRLKIPIPSASEINKIVAILEALDKAISKTQQIITQIQQRNKGLMQQLLIGKIRLKEFKNEWKKLKIYEIAKEVSLKNKEDKTLTVLSCTKYDGLVPSLEYFGRRVFGSDTSTYKIVPKGHFAYATNHIEEGSIGYQTKYDEALISPMYTVFKTSNDVNDDFLYKLLKSHDYIHQYCKRMEGSIDRRGGLRWEAFSKIPVILPEYDEQLAITSLINIAVEEVSLYEKQLSKLQKQKNGLMQKLLTGEVRVKIDII